MRRVWKRLKLALFGPPLCRACALRGHGCIGLCGEEQ
jgi:hypothetical protein